MSNQNQPQLCLGQPPEKPQPHSARPATGWLRLLVGLQMVSLACLVALLLWPGRRGSLPPAGAASGGAERLKAAALALEDRSLHAQAAQTWEDYLEANPQAPDRAEILYRIGKLYMQAEKFGQAAAALVRSELAAGGDGQLVRKIGPRLVECLRRLGLYGEVDRELSRRVEAGAGEVGKGKVLAVLAGEELTDADLDRMIGQRADQLLAVQGLAGDELARQQIIRRFSTPQARRQMLQELLQTELFCRRARELKLDRQEQFLQARRYLEENLLANLLLARQLEKIQPTDVDLRSYYKANQDRYRQPESARVWLIGLAAGEQAAGLLAKIHSADDFRRLAAQREAPATPAAQPWPARTIVRGRPDPLLGDVESLFELPEGQWTQKPHSAGGRRYLVLVDKKVPPQVAPFSEVAEQVRADYVALKRQELSQQLFRDLLARYNVRIMPAGKPRTGSPQPPGGPSKPKAEPSATSRAKAQVDKEEMP